MIALLRILPCLLALALALCLAVPVHAATIHVPSAEPTIQAGIDAASPGDTVLVAPGTYTGAGNRDIDFGGKDVVLQSAAGPDVTIIDCEDLGRGFYFRNGETSYAVVEGFTIVNGNVANQLPAGYGGGMRCELSSSPTVSECKFVDNKASGAWGRGGAVYAVESSPTFTRCTFLSNDSYNGGAIYMRGSLSTFVECLIWNNSSVANGGGAYCGEESAPVFAECSFIGNMTKWNGAGFSTGASAFASFSKCVFSGNSADGNGGAMAVYDGGSFELIDCLVSDHTVGSAGGGLYCRDGTATVTKCTLIGNSAVNWGGGASFERSVATVSECLFVGNSAGPTGGAIHTGFKGTEIAVSNSTLYANSASAGSAVYLLSNLNQGPTVVVTNSILSFGLNGEAVQCELGSVATLTCTDIYGNAGGDWTGCIADQLGINANFSADPRFCAPLAGDFTIAEDSPCAPENSPVDCGLIGALPVACVVPIGIAELPAPSVTPRLRVMPNPIRPSTVIEFADGGARSAVLRLYDVEGRLVLRRELSGSRVYWRDLVGANELASGIYYFNLDGAATQRRVAKITVIR